VSWDLDRRALQHIENRTRFPDVQDTAGSFNAKRAYLGAGLASRLRIAGWQSETHVMAGLWSWEVLHALRLRPETFRSVCPSALEFFARWWDGTPVRAGRHSVFVVLDPLASGRQRTFVGLDEAMTTRTRYRGYLDAADAIRRSQSSSGQSQGH
jgi:hypothetical protein